MEVKLKTLTPIWTGDAERKGNRLRETGIIGSLRWWYEALVRGLGGYACDPTDDKRQFDSEAYRNCLKQGKGIQEAIKQGLKNVCPVCQLFGCTGWRRKFIFHIDPLKKSYAPFVIAKPPRSNKPYFLGYYDKSGNEYRYNGGLMGEYKLTLLVQNEGYLNLIKLLLKLAANWGIGAGVQKGFGIVYIKDDIRFSEVKIPLAQNQTLMGSYNLPLPRIDQFFFYRVPIKDTCIDRIRDVIKTNVYKTMNDCNNNNPLDLDFSEFPYIPTAPWIRRSIRHLFNDDILRHFIMGFVSIKGSPKPMHLDCWKHSIVSDKNNESKFYCMECKHGNIEEKDIVEKTGSKIFVSHIYDKNAFLNNGKKKWEMKIWGWIPDLPEKIGKKREDVKCLLEKHIKSEEFWKDIFAFDESPVSVENIWGRWGLSLSDLLNSGGEIYE